MSNDSIFRAYDIRGDNITPEIATQIGQAIGSEAEVRGQKTIVVARDGRLSSPSLQEALIGGLLATGRDVINIGMVPTPVLYFATHYLKTGSGVMVTGSHNPPKDNGFKIVLGGDTLCGDAIQALKTRINAGNFITGSTGTLHTSDVLHAYVERITKDVKLASRPQRFKVVVDCGNGVAGVIAKQLLEKLGCEVIQLYCEVDGHFPGHSPDPARPENLKKVIEKVKAEGADLGLAFDGDADRLGVVDANGKIIWPDRQMMLYAKDILKRQPGAKIVFDVKSSGHLGNAIKRHGGEPIMWKTGHSFIKSKMKEEDAALGGEMSGHFCFKERWNGFDDALYAATRLLEILSQETCSPTDVFASLPDALNTPDLELKFEGENGKSRSDELMEKIRHSFQLKDAEICTIDGIRADFQDRWGLMRLSNTSTTPCLVFRFEACTQAALENIQKQFRQQLLAMDKSLILPF